MSVLPAPLLVIFRCFPERLPLLPIVPEDPPDYEQDGLLASVIARGLIYRPTP